MTVEERLTKLEENLLVQAQFLDRFEKDTHEWMKRTDEWMKHTQGWNDLIQGWVAQAEGRISQLEAISKAVLERMDRFIRSREGNGQES
ncbi:MAG TPA: hypothetical protein VKW70_07810 [Terriglobia bacterium]|nr:hypothetical protein [Terriglobia bacterium]